MVEKDERVGLTSRKIFYPGEQFKKTIIALSLTLCIALSWYLYMGYGLRAFFFYIYYLPILVGAIYYGLKGGLVVSLTVSILYAIVLVSVTGERGAFLTRDFLVKIVFFNLTALLIGRISQTGLRYRSQILYLKEYNENIVESITEGLITTDRSGRITGINKEIERHTDLKKNKILGKYFWDLFPPRRGFDWRTNLSHILKTGATIYSSGVKYRPPLVGKEIILNIRSQPLKDAEVNIIGTVSLVDYVTKEARLEKRLRGAYRKLETTREELLQSSKMSVMGRMAGGIAHELNSPLEGILGFTQVALLDTGKDETKYRDLKAVEKAALHCKEITSRLLNFSYKTKGKFTKVDVNKAIRATLALSSYQAGLSNIEIVQNLSSNLNPVTGNFNRLQQVFLNLLTNARDAMSRGGRLTIATRNIARGKKAEVTFIDTGSGISKEDIKKLFQPFFTTKEAGRGVGLGLSISHGIIKDHKGEIRVRNKKGGGTEFKIILPASQTTKRGRPSRKV